MNFFQGQSSERGSDNINRNCCIVVPEGFLLVIADASHKHLFAIGSSVAQTSDSGFY